MATNIDFYYPFDSVSGDRAITAAVERRYWAALFGNGVIGADALKATAYNSTGTFRVASGVAIVGGSVGGITANYKQITVTPAMGAYRYIVLRLNTASAVRSIVLDAVDTPITNTTQAQLDSGGTLDLVLARVQNNSGTYELQDMRTFCTSFDNVAYEQQYEAVLAELRDTEQATLAALNASFQAVIDEADTENAGLYGAAGRQGFINPTFTVAQRYTGDSWTQSTGTLQTVDKWAVRIGGRTTSAPIVSNRWMDGQRSSFYIRNKPYASASGSVPGASCLLQNIEQGVRTFCNGGKQFTISFDAKSTTAQRVAVEPVQIAQAGGTGVTIPAQIVNVTTSWQRFSLTFTGTLDVTADQVNDVLKIGFFFAWINYTDRFGSAVNNDATISFANMQINEGTAALPCYVKPYGDELEACKRYYVQLGSTNLSVSAQNANTRGLVTSPLPLTRTMRALPSVTLYDRAGTVGSASVETSAGTWKNGLPAVRSSNSSTYPVFVVTNNNNDSITRVEFSKIILDAELTD